MIKRILLGLLVLVLLIMTVPPLRRRAQPAFDRIGALEGWAVEGPLSPAVNPYRKLKAEGAIGKVTREMIRDRNSGFVRPDDDEFQAYMIRKVEGEDGIDPWGIPYAMWPTSDSVTVVSAGADREFGTDDDIQQKIRYGEPSPARRRRR